MQWHKGMNALTEGMSSRLHGGHHLYEMAYAFFFSAKWPVRFSCRRLDGSFADDYPCSPVPLFVP